MGRSEDYDVFVSHATEDKDFAQPLAHGLRSAGLRVWYDDFELRVGDSLNERINEGLSRSKYGVVVLSPTFFSKHWTKMEMNAFVARQAEGSRVILPIWHRITRDEIIEQAPSLADIASLDSSKQTGDEIVREIFRKVNGSMPSDAGSHIPAPAVQGAGPRFAVFYVAQANTPELPRDEEPERSFHFAFGVDQGGWFSVMEGDEELEYVMDGTILRVRTDWTGHWAGGEYRARQLLSGDQPFALTLRPRRGAQTYLPYVVNESPVRGHVVGMGLRGVSRSGWIVLEIGR